jgi:uncharacterized protein with FMN-binding domain
MKRALLSLAALLLFAGYSFYYRVYGGTKTMAMQPMAQQTATAPSMSSMHYRDGTYTGPTTNAFYGKVQVQAVVKNGRLASVQFLKQPHSSSYTKMINAQATPVLKKEAIKKQSAHVQVVSSASQTSAAFIQSLGAALKHAS